LHLDAAHLCTDGIDSSKVARAYPTVDVAAKYWMAKAMHLGRTRNSEKEAHQTYKWDWGPPSLSMAIHSC